MQTTETLPFSVSLWSEDDLRIDAVLASTATLSTGRAAFDTAALGYPDRKVTLIGPGTLETRPERVQAGTLIGGAIA
jgi:hypothetical protein